MEKLVVPYHLSVLYPYNTAISATSPDILISILGVVLVAVFVVWGWKMQRKLIFGLLFFIATIGLTLLNFYRNQDISFAADHYAYLPSIGFLYFLVLGAWMICTSIGRGMTLRFVTIAGGLVILLFALLAHNQSSIWHDSEELFTNALKYYPDTLSARMNLITLYLDSGKPDAAMQQAKELLLLQERGRTHRLIGDIYLDEHKYAEAEQEYKTAVSMEPNSPEHYIRLGDLYAIQGRLKEAEQQYLHVLALDPKQIDVYDNLASVYLAETRYEDAEDTARKMLAEQPLSDRGHYILGISLERQHKIVDAISEFEQTVTLNPMNADAFASLAADYLYMGRNDLALSMLKKAYTLDPSNSAVQGLAHSIVQMGIVRFGTGTGQTQ
jgi:tetratricopeptide (TPR) repeat protein